MVKTDCEMAVAKMLAVPEVETRLPDLIAGVQERASHNLSLPAPAGVLWDYFTDFRRISWKVFLSMAEVFGVSKNDRKISCTTVRWAAWSA